MSSFDLSGDLELEKGANVKLWFDTYVQGKPGYVNSTQRDHDGPYAKPLDLSQKFGTERRLWSECAGPRSLNSTVRMRVTAEGGAAKGKSEAKKLTITLDERPCSES